MAKVTYELGSFMKASIDGVNGSGKSGTSARLAVGISKELCNGAPVLVADSEERWRVYEHTIFKPEGVPLIRMAGNSLISLQTAIDAVEAKGCCVFVGDQLTTPWKEGLLEFSDSDGHLSFEKRQQLMKLWMPFIERYRYGQFHAICCGRIGYEWEYLEGENGRLQLTKGDTKFNAGGGENFGYEADLELEMQRNKRRFRSLIRAGTKVEYICDVIKDATVGVLNGEQFVFAGQKGLYKVGEYQQVFKAFAPYLKLMREIAMPVASGASTRQLMVGGKTTWAKDQSERKALLEELDNLLSQCFPGGEKRSKLDAMFRNLTLEFLNGYSSWSRMEEEATTVKLIDHVAIVKNMRARMQAGERVVDQNSLAGLLHLSTEDVLHPGHGKTLFEIMAAYSGGKNGKARGPQPVVDALDREAQDEVVS
jgi:hypothetical protein